MRRTRSDEPLRVLLVDGETLRALIEDAAHAQVVGIAPTVRDALVAADEHLPDVVVVEQAGLDRSPSEATHALRRRAPDSSVVVFTKDRDEDTLIDVIVAGGAAYLPHDLSGPPLHALLRCVARGGVALDPWAARVLLQRLGRAPGTTGPELITPEERALLERLAAAPSACTEDETAAALAASACAKLRDASFICA